MKVVLSCFVLIIAISSTNLAQLTNDSDSRSSKSAPTGVGETCIPIYDAGNNYYQSFDSLAATGTSSSLPSGFFMSESGSNANTTYTAGTGSSGTGDTFSFGATGETDRALGGLLSGSLIPLFGGCIVNRSDQPITWISMTYVGEQWRLGSAGRADRLDFQYSSDATSLNSGTWVDDNELDFIAPITTGSARALDGNTGGVGLSKTFTTLNIPVNGQFWFRWTDFNASGADDGLAIDDFNIKVPVVSAADTFISGRVLNQLGNGIANTKISVVGSGLESPSTVLTNPFGYYKIDGLTAGQTYIISINSKNYFFKEPVRAVNLNESLSDLDWISSN